MLAMPYTLPDATGHFGSLRRRFRFETLIAALDELKAAYAAAQRDAAFMAEFNDELKHYVGRPSPIYHARRWSQILGGAQIYLKREGPQPHRRAQVEQLLHRPGLAGPAHGQAAGHRRDRRRQHGVATATVAARYGMECVVTWGARTSSVRPPTSIA